jgi:hypothetical protein
MGLTTTENLDCFTFLWQTKTSNSISCNNNTLGEQTYILAPRNQNMVGQWRRCSRVPTCNLKNVSQVQSGQVTACSSLSLSLSLSRQQSSSPQQTTYWTVYRQKFGLFVRCWRSLEDIVISKNCRHMNRRSLHTNGPISLVIIVFYIGPIRSQSLKIAQHFARTCTELTWFQRSDYRRFQSH